jgi:two-component system chemotaxis sensor kinase CheA
MMDPLKTAFKEEAYELLSELETSLLDLEESPGDKEAIGRVFRTMHTIKGSGAMFGFEAIAGFTHEVETLYDQVRSGKASVTKEMIDLTLAAGDCIRRMLDDPDGVDPQGVEELKGAFRAMSSGAPWSGPEAAAPPEASGESVTYRIGFQPHPGIFKTGANPILLLNELRELGVCAVIACMDAVPDLEELDPEECRVSWNIVLTTDQGINAIRDVFIFVEDECELRIEAIHAMGEPRTAEPEEEASSRKLGEILVERGEVSQEQLLQVLGEQKRVGEMLVDAGLVESSRVELALIEQQHVKEVQNRRRQEALASSIRVPAEKLDKLVDLVGELVTVQARLTQTAASRESAELLGIAEEVERLTAELRDNTMNIRMLPIGATFNRFKRLVRDLSGELGKDVQLVTEGAETELDKTVIERLNDPLVHLIRNSIDHGIEAPDARESVGKPRQGTVRLLAAHSGADVVIRIEDDGAGLDGDAIRSKGVERGLIGPDAELSEREVFALIFSPGFSTAKEVSSVSGRGVGMDVVKRSIEALRGIIDIESRRGEGTAISLKLPLTLAIIDGLLVQIGDARFVLPLSNIEECVELGREDAMRSHGREMIYLRGEIVPYIRLREQFGVEGEAPLIEQVVVAGTGGGKMGFVVDKVIGERQTVIKSLGRVYRDVPGISGATILGDGTVALIVDVLSLVREVELAE